MRFVDTDLADKLNYADLCIQTQCQGDKMSLVTQFLFSLFLPFYTTFCTVFLNHNNLQAY